METLDSTLRTTFCWRSDHRRMLRLITLSRFQHLTKLTRSCPNSWLRSRWMRPEDLSRNVDRIICICQQRPKVRWSCTYVKNVSYFKFQALHLFFQDSVEMPYFHCQRITTTVPCRANVALVVRRVSNAKNSVVSVLARRMWSEDVVRDAKLGSLVIRIASLVVVHLQHFVIRQQVKLIPMIKVRNMHLFYLRYPNKWL